MLPAHLAGPDPTGLQEGQPIAQFEIGSMRNFVYLLIDWPTRKAAIVDPQADLQRPLAALEKHSLELSAILLTHTHHDHVGGVPALLQARPELPIHVHASDRRRLSRAPASNIRELADGDTVRIGEMTVLAMHTPGHSSGELCYRVDSSPPFLFTGDTLFIRDCGRTDLDSGDTGEMFRSLQRIKILPGETVILPGHHYARECASTLARELETSPPLRCASAAELEALP